MYWWVSAAVRQHIVENFRVDPVAIDDSIEQAVRIRIDADAVDKIKPTEAELAAGEIDSQGKLTEEFLVNLLQDGEVPLFEASFARATKIPLKLARRMLYETGGEGLAMACKAGGFSAAMFIRLYRLTRQANTASEPPDERDVVRLTDLYDCMRTTSVEALVKRWQRDPDFLHALNQLNAKI